MIILSSFQKYLGSKVTWPLASRIRHNTQEQQLLEWAASLPS